MIPVISFLIPGKTQAGVTDTNIIPSDGVNKPISNRSYLMLFLMLLV